MTSAGGMVLINFALSASLKSLALSLVDSAEGGRIMTGGGADSTLGLPIAFWNATAISASSSRDDAGDTALIGTIGQNVYS